MALQVGCVNDLAEIDRLFNETASSVEIAKDVEILYSDSAYVRVKITAPTLKRFVKDAKPRDEFPDGLHVDFIDKNGDVTSTLDALNGIRYTRDKIIIVRNNVILQNTLGEKLETSELIWDEKDKLVYTEKYVKITKPEEIITAYGFNANQDFTEYELMSVQAKMKFKDFKEVLD
jgi:LPS export ABC transporter protein LptC